jgi:hypothetical protein
MLANPVTNVSSPPRTRSGGPLRANNVFMAASFLLVSRCVFGESYVAEASSQASHTPHMSSLTLGSGSAVPPRSGPELLVAGVAPSVRLNGATRLASESALRRALR